MSPPYTPRWAKGDKAENLLPTMMRLYRYIGKYRIHIYVGIAFSFLSTVITLIAPQFLNEAVNTISASVGTSIPMDIGKIAYLMWIPRGETKTSPTPAPRRINDPSKYIAHRW